MDQLRYRQREWGTSVQPLEKPTVPTVLAHRQFMDKNKQPADIIKPVDSHWKKYVNGSVNSKGSIHLCNQKPNPARETVPLKSKSYIYQICYLMS
jgi:hypothetical protein